MSNVGPVPVMTSDMQPAARDPCLIVRTAGPLLPKSRVELNQQATRQIHVEATGRKRKAGIMTIAAQDRVEFGRLPSYNPWNGSNGPASVQGITAGTQDGNMYEFDFDEDEFGPLDFPPQPQNALSAAGVVCSRLSEQTSSDRHGNTPPGSSSKWTQSSTSRTVPWSSSPLSVLEGRRESRKSASRADLDNPRLSIVQEASVKTGKKEKSRIEPALTEPPNAMEEGSKGITSFEERRRLPWSPQKALPHVNSDPPRSGSVAHTMIDDPARHRHQSEHQFPWQAGNSSARAEQARLRKMNGMPTKGKKLIATVEPSTDNSTYAIRPLERPRKVPKLFLSQEQKAVLELVVTDSKSVFFTGSAGTGKSVLLRELIAELRQKYKREADRVAVTASTGLAACNIGGVTLHSFAGIGLGKESADELVKKIQKNSKAKTRWTRTKVLVVDEISMVDGELFDKLEHIAKKIRKNGRPFGGIQLVITGDFFQLPPVPDYGKLAKFCFEAATWPTAIHHTIGLTQVFRQKDATFANVLNQMRLGKLTPESISLFTTLSRPVHYDDDLEATELFPTRQEVERSNAARMNNLEGDVVKFDAFDGGMIQDRAQRDKLLSNCMAPQVLQLKTGAQVMLIKNMDEQLVNGSLGKVTGFMNEKTFEMTHPEQSSHGPESVLSDDESSYAQQQRKKQRLPALTGDSIGGARNWPLVRFPLADGTDRELLIQSESWKIELPNGEVQASRTQVPLILAWALSIHKAQGQTLERVKVDLGKVFEKGQAYVALSRATRQEGLQVLRFDPRKVMAHDKVKEFYDRLYDLGKPSIGQGQKASAASTSGTRVKAHCREFRGQSIAVGSSHEQEDRGDLPKVYHG